MNSIIRVANVVNKVDPLNPQACLQYMKASIETLRDYAPDIIVLPALALSGASCGSMYANRTLLEICKEQLDELTLYSANFSSYIIAGLPVNDCGRPVSVCAVLHAGSLVGYLPSFDSPADLLEGRYSDLILPEDTVFSCGDLNFCVSSCDPMNLPLKAQSISQNNCDLVVVPSYQPVVAGYVSSCRDIAKNMSASLGCAISVCNGGIGDTSSPRVYKGFACIFECGEEMSFAASDTESIVCINDIDIDIIKATKLRKKFTSSFADFKRPHFSALPNSLKKGLLRNVTRDPFLPGDPVAAKAYLEEFFSLQVSSLATRLRNIGCKKAVVGVSGGLDSTLALLVACRAMDQLGLPRQNVLGVTMPGFGTTDRTYYNALRLIEDLGATGRDISIKAGVLQHFQDIGHNSQVKDVTYENAQARERTQVLLDLANKERGLVVGTGDLSEEALGWCTFAGDQIANFNVNTCATKNMIRKLTSYLAAEPAFAAAAETLADILGTPVSPELLPPDEMGETTQKTEDILGPYELHDFFLYYFVKYGFRPSKIFFYACFAFCPDLEKGFIKGKLLLFMNRFFGGQFKRSCAPDGAVLADVSLSPEAFMIPSDVNPAAFIEELNNI